jgi:hypothetical protein
LWGRIPCFGWLKVIGKKVIINDESLLLYGKNLYSAVLVQV